MIKRISALLALSVSLSQQTPTFEFGDLELANLLDMALPSEVMYTLRPMIKIPERAFQGAV